MTGITAGKINDELELIDRFENGEQPLAPQDAEQLVRRIFDACGYDVSHLIKKGGAVWCPPASSNSPHRMLFRHQLAEKEGHASTHFVQGQRVFDRGTRGCIVEHASRVYRQQG